MQAIALGEHIGITPDADTGLSTEELNMGAIMNSFRLSLVGAAKGPDLFEIIDAIGVEETAKRIRRAVETIGPRE